MKRPITFDGMDIDRDGEWLAVPVINVWEGYKYDPREKIVTRVEHGAPGILLERIGNKCKVQVGDAVGYVTDWFIRELKQDWLKKREAEAKGAG